MFLILLISTFLFIMSNLILKMSMLISKKNKLNKEKMSPFECGFDPFYKSRAPFSIRFFLITIIFLIFDVEIALILPLISTFKYSSIFIWSLTSIALMTMLILGVIYEWIQGALNWK